MGAQLRELGTQELPRCRPFRGVPGTRLSVALSCSVTPTPRPSLHAFTEACSETQKQAHSFAHRKLGKKPCTDMVGFALKKISPGRQHCYRIDKNRREAGRPVEQMAVISAGGAGRAEGQGLRGPRG